jgi:hypothetical protein
MQQVLGPLAPLTRRMRSSVMRPMVIVGVHCWQERRGGRRSVVGSAQMAGFSCSQPVSFVERG